VCIPGLQEGVRVLVFHEAPESAEPLLEVVFYLRDNACEVAKVVTLRFPLVAQERDRINEVCALLVVDEESPY